LNSRSSPQSAEEKTLKVIIFDLIADSEKLRKIDKEIGIAANKTQISHLMGSRRKLLKRINSTRVEIEKRVLSSDGAVFRLFKLVCRVLNSTYGRKVGESILMTFERQSGLSSLETVKYPEIFEQVLINTFGAKAADKIGAILISEIGSECGFHFSNQTSLKQAILSASGN